MHISFSVGVDASSVTLNNDSLRQKKNQFKILDTGSLMQQLTKLKTKLKLKATGSETTLDAVFLSTDARCISLSSTTTLPSIARFKC